MGSTSHKDFQDLSTEDKRLELLFKHIEDKQGRWYNTLFNQNADAIVICETDSGFPSTIVECNKEFKQVIKHPDEYIIGFDFMDLMRQGEKRKYFVQTFSNENKNGTQAHNLPLTFVQGDGKEITLEISTKMFESSIGKLTMITLRPINHHRSVLENGLEQILLNSNQIFCGIKSEDILQFDYVSLSAFKITGYSADQLILNPFLFWYNCHPEDFNKLKEILMNNNNFGQSIEVRFIQQNGKMIWLNLDIIKCPKQNNNDTTYYMMVQEITHTKRLQRLQQKKDKYRHLLSSTAKQLLRQNSKQDIIETINSIGRNFPTERMVIFFSNGKDTNFTHNYFKSSTTMDERTESIASTLFLQEFKDDLKKNPIILFHPDRNCYEIEQKHHQFLKKSTIDSMLLVPLINDNKIMGLILCSNIHDAKCWDRTDISFISELSELFSAFSSVK